jgi:transcriptional regulator, asnC family
LNLKNPEKFDDVVEALRQIPEIVECHYTTGEYDLFLKIYAYNNHHLMSVIHDKLMPLGLSRSESSISYNAVIDRTLPIEGMKVADVVLDDDEEDEE